MIEESADEIEVLRYEDFNVNQIVTPVNVRALEKLLRESKYCEEETKFLVEGFKYGFRIGYHGPENRRDRSKISLSLWAIKQFCGIMS